MRNSIVNQPLDTATVRNRKRKALLAGGTVLGLGAAVTLAAWTDDVWATVAFSAGEFNIQGAVDSAGTDWREYNTSPGGTLTFTVAPQAMSPGTSVYAPLNLRVDPAANDYNAAVSLPTAPTGPTTTTPTAADNAFFNALRVSLFQVPPDNCNAGDTADPISGFTEVPLTTTTTNALLTVDRLAASEGLCFRVTLPSGAPTAVQGGQTGALTWQFHAESVEP